MNLKNIYAFILNTIQVILGVDAAKVFDTYLRFHRKINLKNPKTLADKVSFIELHEQSEFASRCTDKFEVRNYITSKGYDHILVPVVGGPWDKFDEINFNDLPSSFALKATHGCKMNYMVLDKSKLNIEKCRAEVNRWLNTTYGTYSMEPHYIKIPHRIYAEKYLGDMSGLIDYKFHCMNGVPQFVITITDRKTDGDKAMKATLDLFDMQWNSIPEVIGANSEKAGNGNVKKPECFEEMVKIATDLSKDFKFVRVDLYEINHKVKFGELTFSPACCVFPYLSDAFISDMGSKLTI